jgi:hypothetical protein
MLIGCGLRRAGVVGPAPGVDPAAGGALGHCRSRGQGWPRAHGSDSHLGEGCRGRVDGCSRYHGGPGVPSH